MQDAASGKFTDQGEMRLPTAAAAAKSWAAARSEIKQSLHDDQPKAASCM